MENKERIYIKEGQQVIFKGMIIEFEDLNPGILVKMVGQEKVQIRGITTIDPKTLIGKKSKSHGK